jgi:type IV secretion system protein VirB8
MSAESAMKEFRELWSANNSENPSIKLGKKTSLDIRIKSDSFIDENIASVRFLKEKRTPEGTSETHWNAVLEFRYSGKPMRMEDRFQNPLGFQVVSYRVSQEILETVR